MSTSAPVQSPLQPTSGPRRRHLWLAILAGVAVVIVVLAGTILVRSRSASDTAGSTSGPVPASSAAQLPPATSSPLSPAPSASSTAPGQGAAFAFVPLWPFGSVGDAISWQQVTAGRQAWRLDAGQTALNFARSFLGYTEMTRVSSTKLVADQAWIGVAADPPEGRVSTAGVLHLARIGAGPLDTRPWEVVGSEDTTLTLTTPRYGSQVGPMLTVGGRITGVDESLAIQVKMLGDRVLGRVAGIPAGGQNTPWSGELALESSRSGPAVVAVSTGGHLLTVEKFAITGVRVRATPSYATSQQALASLVSSGTYVGSCADVTGAPTATRPVCSAQVARHADRYLYRVGYWRTDSGFFAVLARTSTGRWLVVSLKVAGADVPADLGGPIAE